MRIRSPDAETVGRLLGGKRSGRQYLCKCPAHDDRHPSLLVFDGHTSVQVRCQAGCDSIDVLRAINAIMGGRDVERVTPRSQADDDREAAAHAKMALRIWREAIDPIGTMAEAYLNKGRTTALRLPAEEPGEVIRFHPACPRSHDRQPALIALMRCIETNKARAIQRIYLTPDAKKDGAMMLGPAGGCAMKLISHWHTFWDDLNYCPHLYVCEGFETGLALLMMGFKPVWALGSAVAIGNFKPLFGIGRLMICADNDEAGLRAAERCQERWSEARATIWVTNIEGYDAADLIGGPHDQRSA